MEYIDMPYPVEYTDEFVEWWDELSADEQESVAYSVGLLKDQGMHLRRPYADTIHGSQLPNMRELRCQHRGRPYRILFAFNPQRTALLLIGGDKTGRSDWYEEYVPKAERIYEQHLRELTEEAKEKRDG